MPLARGSPRGPQPNQIPLQGARQRASWPQTSGSLSRGAPMPLRTKPGVFDAALCRLSVGCSACPGSVLPPPVPQFCPVLGLEGCTPSALQVSASLALPLPPATCGIPVLGPWIRAHPCTSQSTNSLLSLSSPPTFDSLFPPSSLASINIERDGTVALAEKQRLDCRDKGDPAARPANSGSKPADGSAECRVQSAERQSTHALNHNHNHPDRRRFCPVDQTMC